MTMRGDDRGTGSKDDDEGFSIMIKNRRKNMKKYILILGLILCFNASADDLPSCGENCTYSYTQNGTDQDGNITYTLTIKPIDSEQTAKVQAYDRYNYTTKENPVYAPWRFENVTSVVIEKGITYIGDRAFEDMQRLKTLELPEGLKTIGHESFHNTKIQKVDLPSTLTGINSYAFSISALKEINKLPEGLKVIGAQAFSNTQIKDWIIPSSVTTLSPSAFGINESGYDKSLIENLYCAQEIADQCEAAVQWKKDLGKTVKVTTYNKDGNKIFYKNHWYNNANDILSGDYIKKRIYTIDEANQVAGKVNSVKIRYR